jgi:hypothetical protein
MTFVAAAGCPLGCAAAGDAVRRALAEVSVFQLNHFGYEHLWGHSFSRTWTLAQTLSVSVDGRSTQAATRSELLFSASNVCEPLHLCVRSPNHQLCPTSRMAAEKPEKGCMPWHPAHPTLGYPHRTTPPVFGMRMQSLAGSVISSTLLHRELLDSKPTMVRGCHDVVDTAQLAPDVSDDSRLWLLVVYICERSGYDLVR